MGISTLRRLTRLFEQSGWKKPEIYAFLRQFVIRRLAEPHFPLAPENEASSFRTPPAAALSFLQCQTPRPEGTDGAFLTPQTLSMLYEFFQPQHKTQGIFYTPWKVAAQTARAVLSEVLVRRAGLTRQEARALLEQGLCPLPRPQALALDAFLSRLSFCDPAAGAGGLLVPFVLELTHLRQTLNPALNGPHVLLSLIQHNLYAGDISERALEELRLRLALVCRQQGMASLPGDFCPHLFAQDALACCGGKSIWRRQAREIFDSAGGFDVILSNPPYLGQKNHRPVFEKLRQNPLWKHRAAPKSDLLYFFFYLALDILKEGGIGGFVTTSYFTSAAGAFLLRKELKEKAAWLRLQDFEDQRLFERAAGQHTLFSVFEKNNASEKPPCQIANQILPQAALYRTSALWIQTRVQQTPLESALLKMETCPHTLQEIACVTNGLMTGCDKISASHLRRFRLPGVQKGEGVFVLSEQEKENLHLTAYEKQKLKPFFKNSDISPYTARQTPKRWLIDFFYPNDRELDFARYGHLRAHLARFAPVLLARKQNNNGINKLLARGVYWFGSVRRKMDFEAEKIVVPQRSPRNTFAFAAGPWYASSDVYFISNPKDGISLWYLLGLFNSAPYFAWLSCRGKRKGKLLELYAAPLKALPVPDAAPEIKRSVETLAQEIYRQKSANSQADIHLLQAQINQHVYHLLGLTAQEVQAMEAYLQALPARAAARN